VEKNGKQNRKNWKTDADVRPESGKNKYENWKIKYDNVCTLNNCSVVPVRFEFRKSVSLQIDRISFKFTSALVCEKNDVKEMRIPGRKMNLKTLGRSLMTTVGSLTKMETGNGNVFVFVFVSMTCFAVSGGACLNQSPRLFIHTAKHNKTANGTSKRKQELMKRDWKLWTRKNFKKQKQSSCVTQKSCVAWRTQKQKHSGRTKSGSRKKILRLAFRKESE